MAWLETTVVVIVSGLATFAAAFFGVRWGGKRAAYERHVDKLVTFLAQELEPRALQFHRDFDGTSLASATRPEHEDTELEGFERRNYWDIPDIVAWPWNQPDVRPYEMCRHHWPELDAWEAMRDEAFYAYECVTRVDKILVHLYDGMPMEEIRKRGIELVEGNRDYDPRLHWMRRFLGEVGNTWFDGTELGINEYDDHFRVHLCGATIATAPDKEAASWFLDLLRPSLERPRAFEAAHEAGQAANRASKLAEALCKSIDGILRTAHRTGQCPGCGRGDFERKKAEDFMILRHQSMQRFDEVPKSVFWKRFDARQAEA